MTDLDEIAEYEQDLKDLGFTESVEVTRGRVLRTIKLRTIKYGTVTFTGSVADCIAFVSGWKVRVIE